MKKPSLIDHLRKLPYNSKDLFIRNKSKSRKFDFIDEVKEIKKQQTEQQDQSQHRKE